MLPDLRAAFAFLTVLPLRYPEGRPPGRAFAYFPLVGLLIGGVLAALAAILPVRLVPFVTLAVWVILTGGLHLDGFGDACDGLVASVPPERRLDIMKDPRTGSWAVVGLALLLIGKASLLPGVAPALLIVPPVAGRWAMTVAAYGFPYARASGLGAYFRDGLGRAQVLAATMTLLIVAGGVSALASPVALLALAIAPATVLILGRWAQRRLGGGLTGDVYGALCEMTELLCLVGFVWAKS